MTTAAISAELYGVRHRKAFWACLVVWVLQIVLFAYVVNFVVAQTVPEIPADQVDVMLASVMPAAASSQIIGSLPMYGAPIMIIVGALLAAGDSKSGAIRTVLSRFPDRGGLVTARLVTLAALVIIMILASGVAAYTMSFVFALVVEGDASIASVGAIFRDMSYSVLVAFAWASMGYLLGTLTRSLAAAIAMGLLWALVVEQALNGLASVVSGIDVARSFLVGGASQVLSYDAGVASMQGGGPPHTSPLGGILVLIAWIALCALASVVLLRRRDI